MPRNTSAFGDIPISPLSGRFDLRSNPGTMPVQDFRIVLNASMNELGKRCRRPGWRKFGSSSPIGHNNQDLHDTIIEELSYCNNNTPSDCPCPSGFPDCLRVTDLVRFAYIADWGKPSNTPHPEDVEAMVKDHAPEFIVTGGDNKYSANFEAVFDLLPYYKTFVDAQLMFPAIGNHDVLDGGGLADYYATFPYLPGNQRYYNVRKGPVEFFLMNHNDTVPDDPDGQGPGSVQAAWLEAALAASTAPWKVVISQDPPYTSDANGANYPGHETARLPYKDWGADIVLSGDSHFYERFEVNDLPYIVCGSGGATPANFSGVPVDGSLVRYNAKYGGLICEATRSSLSIEFRNTDDTVVDSLTLTKTGHGLITRCVDGEESDAQEWAGELVSTGGCSWGIPFGGYSLEGDDVAAIISVRQCDTYNIYQLDIVLRTAGGQSLVLWTGESPFTPIGTYLRINGCTTTESLLVESCLACAQPVITADPVDGTTVPEGSYVSLFATGNATIFYTTDGTNPTNQSTLYTGPFPLVDGGSVVRAIAYSRTCISEIYEFNYELIDADSFRMQYLCNSEDRAGVFGEFSPNGTDDYCWNLVFDLPGLTKVKRVEVYETNPEGVWITGQAWATSSPIYPAELGGRPFTIYPVVVFDSGTQINSGYVGVDDYVFDPAPPGPHEWLMFGQPFVGNVGYFKLVFIYNDGVEDKTIVTVIPNECLDEYYGGYYGYEEPEPTSGTSIASVAFKHIGASPKSGAAAIGLPGDRWNTFNYMLQSQENGQQYSEPLPLRWADGSSSGMTLVSQVGVDGGDSDATQSMFQAEESTTHSDQMMKYSGKVNVGNDTCFFRITGTYPGLYNIYVYGHGNTNNKTLKCHVRTPTVSFDSEETSSGSEWLGEFVEGENYVLFSNVNNTSVEGIEIVLETNTGDGLCYLNGIQIEKLS